MLKKNDYKPSGTFRTDILSEFPTSAALAKEFAEAGGREPATEPLIEMMRELNRPISEMSKGIGMFVPRFDYFMFRVCEDDPKTTLTTKPFDLHKELWEQQAELWARTNKEKLEVFKAGDMETLARLVTLCYDSILRPYSIIKTTKNQHLGRVEICANVHVLQDEFGAELRESEYFSSLCESCEVFLRKVVEESGYQRRVETRLLQGVCKGDERCEFSIVNE